jgi:hypothetical protein
LESLARDLDGFLFGGEKQRIAKGKFAIEAFIGHREHGTGLFTAQLVDG